MRLGYLINCVLFTTKSLLRNRTTLFLLVIIPAVFFIVTWYTTTNLPFWFKLSSVSENTVVKVVQSELAFVFIGLAITGLLSSFLSLILVQMQTSEHKRLILCGYRSGEIIMAKFILLMMIVIAVTVYISLEIQLFFNPDNATGVAAGFLLAGFVYGSYGMLIGTLFRGELEGILFIVLLANLDIGWLQNPVFYTAAQNKEFIRSLPSYFPSQASMVSAFSDHGILYPVLGSIGYGLLFLISAMLIYGIRMKIRRREKVDQVIE
jgi:hypothetical protein